MTDTLRKKLDKRAKEQRSLINHIVPESLRKTPSQKRSENMRKRLASRDGNKPVDVNVMLDCHSCTKYPCGKTPNACMERSMIHRCLKCGQKVRHYIDPENQWRYCPKCKSDMEMKS